ncbi:hypothetical protein [Pseudomonas gozinkensis]|uniref:hypothetical protein n=1 Tax=Pseudomonas gozinkensis TaxID=2774461 RepID=UPI0017879204|nr:hypothetical protein [Pseudomonas gozinkensis]
MRILLSVIAFVFLVACSKKIVVPGSEIEFVSMGDNGSSPLLEVKFSSASDLLNFFRINAGQSQVGNALICSLDDEVFFKERQQLKMYLEGDMVAVDRAGDGLRYIYSASVFAMQTLDGGTSGTFISEKQLLETLHSRDVVMCRFLTASHWYGPYYSEPMKVPAQAFVQAIRHKHGLD